MTDIEEIPMEVSQQIEIESLPQQFRASIPLEYKEVREKFDDFWNKHMDIILQKYPLKNFKKKGGFKKDPKKVLEKTFKHKKLYSSVLTEIFLEKIENVLFIEAIDLFNFEEDTTPYLIGLFYYIPELVLNCQIDELDFSLPAPDLKSLEDEWARRCRELQHKHRVLTNYEGDDVQEDHNALMDIMASCEGSPYEAISGRNTWHIVKDIRFPDLKKAVLEHKKGDLFEINFDIDDKKIEAVVKIHELQTITYPELDDELAQKENKKFNSFSHLKDEFEAGYNSYTQQVKENMVFDKVINEIIQKSTIPIAPSLYVRANASQLMTQHVQSCGGKAEDAARRLGLSDVKAMQQQFEIHAQKNFIRDLALRKYVSLFDVEIEKDNYDKAVKDMVTRVEWIESKKETE